MECSKRSKPLSPEEAEPSIPGGVIPQPSDFSNGLFDRLTDDILLHVLRLKSLADGGYQHALVCKRWLSLSVEAQAKLRIREGALFHESQVVEHMKSFPNLKAVELPRASTWSLTDAFLREASRSHPDLEVVVVRRGSSREVNLMSSMGLRSFMEGCKKLRVLKLELDSHFEDFSSGFILPGANLRCTAGVNQNDQGSSSSSSGLGPNFANLEELELPVRALPQDLSCYSSLKSLSLHCESLSSLPDSLGQLQGLQHLAIDCPRGLSIPSVIATLTSLESLSLSFERALSAPPALLQLPRLRRLSLACAVESVGPLEGRSAAVESSTGLFAAEVTAVATNVNEGTWADGPAAGASAVNDCMETNLLPNANMRGGARVLSPLEYLDIAGCRKLEQLPGGFLQGLRSLRSFAVGNALANVSQENLSNFFPNLEELTVQDFTGKELPRGITSLSSLTQLNLVRCQHLQSVAEEILALPRLKGLRVEGCGGVLGCTARASAVCDTLFSPAKGVLSS